MDHPQTPAARRIAEIMAEHQISSLTAFAQSIGAGFESVKKWRDRDSISKAGATKIAARYGCALEWVLTGRGEKYPLGAAETGEAFADHPEADLAFERRQTRNSFIARVASDPGLFAFLLASYRDIYRAEEITISEHDLIETTLQDYAELLADDLSESDRREAARGMILKQRQWLRHNRSAITP